MDASLWHFFAFLHKFVIKNDKNSFSILHSFHFAPTFHSPLNYSIPFPILIARSSTFESLTIWIETFGIVFRLFSAIKMRL